MPGSYLSELCIAHNQITSAVGTRNIVPTAMLQREVARRLHSAIIDGWVNILLLCAGALQLRCNGVHIRALRELVVDVAQRYH